MWQKNCTFQKTSVASVCIFLGVSEKKGFSVVRGDQIKIKFLTKKKEFLWPWKVKCGKCGDLVMLRPDSNTKGRIKYFEWRK